jgi:hypothetical protein
MILIGRQPSGSSIGAVFGPRIESNRGSRRRPVDRVDDRLEQRKALGGGRRTPAPITTQSQLAEAK